VKSDVADGTGGVGGGLDGGAGVGLVNVAERDAEFAELLEGFRGEPRDVPDFDHQGVFFEFGDDSGEPLPVFRRGRERPGELDEDCTELAGVEEGLHARSVSVDVGGIPGRLALVREAPPELGGEAEVGVVRDALEPAFGVGRWRRPVEAGVNLNAVNVAGEIGEGIEAGGLGRGIDDAFPIGVGPACGADGYFARGFLLRHGIPATYVLTNLLPT